MLPLRKKERRKARIHLRQSHIAMTALSCELSALILLRANFLVGGGSQSTRREPPLPVREVRRQPTYSENLGVVRDSNQRRKDHSEVRGEDVNRSATLEGLSYGAKHIFWCLIIFSLLKSDLSHATEGDTCNRYALGYNGTTSAGIRGLAVSVILVENSSASFLTIHQFHWDRLV